MLWRDGTNYMGQWKRNRPTGFGFEAYPNGSFYQVCFLTPECAGKNVTFNTLFSNHPEYPELSEHASYPETENRYPESENRYPEIRTLTP